MNEIFTQRLHLRQIESSDVQSLILLFTHKEVRKHLGGSLEKMAAEQKANKLVNKEGYFLASLLDDDKIIGLCYLDEYHTGDTEISYQFFPGAWGKGFGREVVAAVIKWGFETMQIDHIIAVTQKTNKKSRKLLEAIGMTIKDEFEEYNEPQVMYIVNRRS